MSNHAYGSASSYEPLVQPERETLCVQLVAADGSVIDRLWQEGNSRSVGIDMVRLARSVVSTSARYLLMEHNHPSGDPRPSRHDIQATRHIWRLARTLGATLWDHRIVAHDGSFSFRTNGLL